MMYLFLKRIYLLISEFVAIFLLPFVFLFIVLTLPNTSLSPSTSEDVAILTASPTFFGL